ncbi:MAG: DsbE family thiol:disulfide interchange protein [Gammaproteobacteria bacterium]
MRRLLLFIPLVLFIILGVFLWRGLSLDPRELPSALIGRPFPEFSLTSLRDPDVLLERSNFLGEPVLVNVWATWCPSCKQEHPELMKIAEERKIILVGLNYKDDRQAALGWLKQYGNPYQFTIYDDEGMLGLDLGVYGAPETYLVDAEGVVRYRHVGVVTPEVWSQLQTQIDGLEAK